jgi:hypothetical protein
MAFILDIFSIKTRYNTKNKIYRDNDLPAIEYADDGKQFWVNGKLHRDNDLPAIITSNKNKHWYVNIMRHRLRGLPAIESADGRKVLCMSVKGSYLGGQDYHKMVSYFMGL